MKCKGVAEMKHDLDFTINDKEFSKILVAIDEDDSQSSIQAFQYACVRAKNLNVPLGIVSIMEIAELNIFESLDKYALNNRRENLLANIEAYIEKAQAYGVQQVQGFIGEGLPGEQIVTNILPKYQPDLLVCGSKTKANKPQKKMFLGSQASYLAQNASCSVIVIR